MTDLFHAADPVLYDRSMPCVVPGLDEARAARREAFRVLISPSNDWVGADVGIGTGSDAATMFFPRARGLLYGVDASAPFTSELTSRQALPAPGIDRVRVSIIAADFAAPGSMGAIRRINPRGIDFVTSAFAIHNVEPERQRTTFENISSLLKPGGLFFYMDLISYEDPSLRRLAQEYDLDFIRGNMRVPPANVNPERWCHLKTRWLKHYKAENYLLPLTAVNGNSVTRCLEEADFSAPVTLYRYLHTTLLLTTKR